MTKKEKQKRAEDYQALIAFWEDRNVKPTAAVPIMLSLIHALLATTGLDGEKALDEIFAHLTRMKNELSEITVEE